jgi:hypothetical protein
MRTAVITIIFAMVLLVGCGSHAFEKGNEGTDAGNADVAVQFLEGGVPEAGCVNLECQQTCASTSISGVVYDPKGLTPLYNVFVYVPNAPLDPITSGPTCTTCQAPASGSPVVKTTTDETGHFTLQNAPSGDAIPLVLQLGKWRRSVVLPHVTSCQDNASFNTKTNPKDKTVESFLRMPRKQAEGSPNDNIPRIAVTTGCDFTECFLASTVGIDSKEFETGGRVDIYDGQQSVSYPTSRGSAVTDLYDNLGTMMKYDLILNSCECNTYDRGSGYANALTYLNAGGRFFGTHFQYNFFASKLQCNGDATCEGAPAFNSVASWVGSDNATYGLEPYSINQDFDKGKAMAKWVYEVQGGTLGQIPLFDVRHDVNMVGNGATSWIYSGNSTSDYSSLYLSFNTPVGVSTDVQCGRAVFSDVHVAGNAYTNFCENGLLGDSYGPNLNALEFLFFDLSSCVQDEKKPPVTPK